jgi:hypothetical protein
MQALRFSDIEEGNDVGVGKRSHRARLLLEAPDAVGIVAVSADRILIATSRPSRGSAAR